MNSQFLKNESVGLHIMPVVVIIHSVTGTTSQHISGVRIYFTEMLDATGGANPTLKEMISLSEPVPTLERKCFLLYSYLASSLTPHEAPFQTFLSFGTERKPSIS